MTITSSERVFRAAHPQQTSTSREDAARGGDKSKPPGGKSKPPGKKTKGRCKEDEVAHLLVCFIENCRSSKGEDK